MSSLLVKGGIQVSKTPFTHWAPHWAAPLGGGDPFFSFFSHLSRLFFPLEFATFGAKAGSKNCVKWGIVL